MIQEKEVNQFISYYKEHVDYENTPPLKDEQYNSLALCLIDAIYSINTKYQAVLNVIDRTKKHFSIKEDKEYTINQFLENTLMFSYDQLADKVFKNRQRTSTVNGILKAEAVIRSARVLKKHKINLLSDKHEMYKNLELINDLKQIPGQQSGISIDYFFMLTGKPDLIKMDRHIIQFVDEALGEVFSIDDKYELLKLAVEKLKNETNIKDLRCLDFSIWNYMSKRISQTQIINDIKSNNKFDEIKEDVKDLTKEEKKELINYLINQL